MLCVCGWFLFLSYILYSAALTCHATLSCPLMISFLLSTHTHTHTCTFIQCAQWLFLFSHDCLSLSFFIVVVFVHLCRPTRPIVLRELSPSALVPCPHSVVLLLCSAISPFVCIFFFFFSLFTSIYVSLSFAVSADAGVRLLHLRFDMTTQSDSSANVKSKLDFQRAETGRRAAPTPALA